MTDEIVSEKFENEPETILPRIVSFNPDIDSLEDLTEAVQESYLPSRKFFDKDVTGIKVKFLYTREEMDRERGSKTPDWVVGSAGKKTIVIFSPKVFSQVSPHPASDFLPVLTHEIAHIFQEGLFPFSRQPYWLMEGLAGYIAEQYKTRIVKPNNKIQDFAEIHYADGWNKTNPYNQAYSFTAYIIERFGKESLLPLLGSVSPTDSFQTFASKFEDAFKCDFYACQKDWVKSLDVTQEEPN